MMELLRSEPFEVLIAVTVKLSITRVMINQTDVYFEVRSANLYHGKVFPALTDDHGIYWKSPDDIHPIFVEQIGKAIESYDVR
jgi:hypothetical protein